MAVSLCCCLIFTVALIAGANSSYMSGTLADHAVKYVCTGGTAILPWRAMVTAGEEVVDMQWGRLQGQDDQLIAMYAHHAFLSMNHYGGRVTFLPNAGLTLHDVTARDTGLYYVQVTGTHANGTLFALRRDASLTVVDSILRTSRLEVKQQSQAVYNTVNKEWSTDLTCGTFVYTGHSVPFDVQWTDPSGQVLNSSFYHNGSFHLLLDNPVMEGNYTCTLPHDVISCHDHGALGNASVHVHSLVARVTVLEAAHEQLQRDNGLLKATVTDAMQDNLLLIQTVADLQHRTNTTLQKTRTYKQQIESLQSQSNATSSAIADLTRRVQQLQSTKGHHNISGPSNTTDTLHDQLQHMQTSASQCNQRTEDLARQYVEMLHHNRQLLTTQHVLAQRLNQTTSRHVADLTSLNASIQQSARQCSGLSGHVTDLETALQQAKVRDSALAQKVKDVEVMSNSSQKTLGDVQSSGSGLRVSDLEQQVKDVQGQLGHVTALSKESDVSFHVRMNKTSDNVRPGRGQPLLLSHVISNRGHAYSPVTGRFTAPRSATYLFLATLAAKGKGYYAEMYLMWDDLKVDFVETYGQSNFTSGAAHAVLHLGQGDTVWLKSHSDSHYNASSIAFSGALLRADP